MHILFLTWKDIRHPHSGGAEKVMYEYASGLVKRGHTVTWFASSYPDAPSEEMIDGIRIIRRYTNHTIWMFAWHWYRGYKKENEIDIIIDEAGGWPLLSPLYEKQIPIYFCTTHIGDREFDVLPPLISWIARYVYRSLFLLYKKTKTITISQSSKQELIHEFGFSEDRIDVVDMTTEIHPISSIDHSVKNHDLVFLGRLTGIKRPDHAVRAFHSILEQLPGDTNLHIIGNAQDKKYVKSLKELIYQLHIEDRVIFDGFLSKKELAHILSSSKCLLVPSEKEGYGLIVIEGNAYGLPAIGYDVAGLRDSIQPGVNGILVGDGDYTKMGEEIVKLFANDDKYRTLCEKSLEHAKNIPTWDEQVDVFEGIITQIL